MRIGIDARLYSQTGPGRYIRNLITHLKDLDKTNEYYIFLLKKDLKNFAETKNFHPVEADFLWYGFAEQMKFPRLIGKCSLDLMHFPHFNIPILYRGKFVVTIHDLIHFDFKMARASTHNRFVYEVKHRVQKQVVKQALKKSQKVITVSNFVKNELKTRLNVEDKKITVTYEAADEKMIDLAKKMNLTDSRKFLEKFGVKPPFILYVGNAHPHKNVEGLIRGFLDLRKKYQYLQLVLVGNNSFFWQRIRKEFSHRDIIYLSEISDEELVALYKNAKTYVFPSFSEGFGLPLLEAMACGCPVVSSNTTSLPEIGSDAALYFNPKNLSEMEEKIMQVLNVEKVRRDLITKGEKRYTEFSWEKMAKQTLEIYKNAIGK